MYRAILMLIISCYGGLVLLFGVGNVMLNMVAFFIGWLWWCGWLCRGLLMPEEC